MPTQTLFRYLSVPLLLTAVLLAGKLVSIGMGEPPADLGNRASAATVPQRDAASLYVGSNKCERCHTHPIDDDKRSGRTTFMTLTEYPKWLHEDKHSLAYDVLGGTNSLQIGRLMGIAPQTDRKCLSCHSVDCSSTQCSEASDAALAALRSLGVSCEACHGPASKWLRVHDDEKAWRNVLPPQAKTAQGLVDLRDPVVRAEKCLSCHLGNAPEGKVVTHEMYAAGHPPVSGFEVETFLDAMPTHWMPADVQPGEIQKHYLDRAYPAKEKMRKTRFMAIGGLVAVREYARLIGYYAKTRATAQAVVAGAGASTELAVYDCQACHHELTLPSWRQVRGYHGHPGRPPARAWPLVLGNLGLAASGEHQASLRKALQSLNDALDRQPFGDPAQVAAAAARIEEECQKAIDSLRLTDINATDLVRAICRIGAQELPDYESARQLGWAFDVIRREAPALAADAEIAKSWAVLRDGLALQLPKEKELVVNKSVPQTLTAAAAYRPETFSEAWRKLESKIP